MPVALIVDRFSTHKSVKLFCDQIDTTLKTLERSTPWANRSELCIGLLKEAFRKDTRESKTPIVIWDHVLERHARINNTVSCAIFQAQAKNLMNALLVIKVNF